MGLSFVIQGIHIADDEDGDDPRGLEMTGPAVGADHRRRRRRGRLFAEKGRIAKVSAGNDKNHLLHLSSPLHPIPGGKNGTPKNYDLVKSHKSREKGAAS